MADTEVPMTIERLGRQASDYTRVLWVLACLDRPATDTEILEAHRAMYEGMRLDLDAVRDHLSCMMDAGFALSRYGGLRFGAAVTYYEVTENGREHAEWYRRLAESLMSRVVGDIDFTTEGDAFSQTCDTPKL